MESKLVAHTVSNCQNILGETTPLKEHISLKLLNVYLGLKTVFRSNTV